MSSPLDKLYDQLIEYPVDEHIYTACGDYIVVMKLEDSVTNESRKDMGRY